MRLRELLVEAQRNGGPTRWIVATATFTVCFLMCWQIYGTSTKVLDLELTQRNQGSLVLVATAATEHGFSAEKCLAATSQSAISHTGGIAYTSPDFTTLDGTRVPAVFAVGDLAGVWDPQLSGSTLVIGSDLAQARGIEPPTAVIGDLDRQPLSTRITNIITTIPNSLRSMAIYSGYTDKPIESCYARAVPGTVTTALEQFQHALSTQSVRVTTYQDTTRSTTSAVDVWRNYWETNPVLVFGLALGVVGMSIAWARRNEFAVYRTFGLKRTDLALLNAIEAWLVYIPAASLGTTLGYIASRTISGQALPPDLTTLAILVPMGAAALLVALAPLLPLALTRVNQLSALKDR